MLGETSFSNSPIKQAGCILVVEIYRFNNVSHQALLEAWQEQKYIWVHIVKPNLKIRVHLKLGWKHRFCILYHLWTVCRYLLSIFLEQAL